MSESAYGMKPQFKPLVIPEYNSSAHKTFISYLQIVSAALNVLPTGYP